MLVEISIDSSEASTQVDFFFSAHIRSVNDPTVNMISLLTSPFSVVHNSGMGTGALLDRIISATQPSKTESVKTLPLMNILPSS